MEVSAAFIVVPDTQILRIILNGYTENLAFIYVIKGSNSIRKQQVKKNRLLLPL